ncbi:ParA family protein [Natronobacterium gregoryi]|uniref:ATPase involved in chromosome partitioning n=2 Tax=Natronobacterium gregoryi TaxID=44930 RepID=L0AKD0_NATGS|nr:ParA family protein [Natronobacterium gregoryi]AFZ73914.1 ATPase involved in chromosome partitioning [Natronobacterium gregoryi SP2]ELY71564.1 cobyrinic acid a,c-diamide synthase [Natronobacterium gregoryi SP2]PLK19057.1 ParA family protein [Natronobacterium gregoryi SP2]SFJ63062.1 chromosome partitioning protein [Natronobacterium gregoryi]
MRGITVTLQKGGVGKTTVSINLAERLAARGHDVLLIDVDPQGSATEGVGRGDTYTADTHLGHVLDPERPTTPVDLVRSAGSDVEFDLVPSHATLDRVAAEIRDTENGEAQLYRKLVRPLADRYDWVVFDSPPTIGPLSNAAIVATRQAVVPLQLSKPSADALTRTVTNQLFALNDRLPEREPIEILALVPNRVSGDNEEKRVLRALEDSQFESYLPPFARSDLLEDDVALGPGIRERVAFRRAYRSGVPLAAYDPDIDMLERLDALAETVEEKSRQIA